MQIVLASNNPGKLREFRALLQPLGLAVRAQGEFGVRSAPEPHATFVENALVKARHAAVATGLPALADDSGLSCRALNGAPGVLSARFAGPDASDARNNEHLLQQLRAQRDRAAHYTCVLVALRAADDPEPVIADARWAGEIIDTPRGSGGFGYDPYFWLPQFQQTAAELAPEHKNRISHRGLAMQALLQKLAVAWDIALPQ